MLYVDCIAKPVYKKWWFWVLVGFFAIGIMGNAVGEKSATVKSENSVPPKNTLSQNIGESVTEATKDTPTPIPVPTEKPQDKVPTEYRNALKKSRNIQRNDAHVQERDIRSANL